MSQNYDAVAEEYRDLVKNKTWPGVIKTKGISSVQRHVEEVKKVSSIDSMALDIACGTGRVTFPLSSSFKRITGIDISSGMIEQARIMKDELGKTNVEFQVMDACKLNLEDESFDTLFSHYPSVALEDMILEIKRVLKKGKYFVISHSGKDHFKETGKKHDTYYKEKTLSILKENDLEIISVYDDYETLWFDTEDDRWSLVLRPYGSSKQITDMEKMIRSFKDEEGYPLTLHTITVVVKKKEE